MTRYSQERKAAVIRRMMPPDNTPVPVLVEETGISDVTGMPDHLYHWRKQARAKGLVVPGDGRNPENWWSEDKFAVVVETAAMNEAELAEYCRKKGLFVEQNALKKQKYRLLYSPGRGRKPGPKGPSREIIEAIVAMKQRNPRYGCPRIAQQINLAFGLNLDKDTVRRVLAVHYKPRSGGRGPSWLTTLGHAKDSLWSIDLFRAESITLKSHWILVVMDQFTRRIIGFAVHTGDIE